METLNAQNEPQLNLPEGVKARLDQGNLTGDIAFSPDSTQLAVACDIGVWVYDVESAIGLNLLVEHREYVRCVAYAPDGAAIASGSIDNTVVLWDAPVEHRQQHSQDILTLLEALPFLLTVR